MADDTLTRDFIAGLTKTKEPTAEDIAKIIREERMNEKTDATGKPIDA